MRITQVKAQRKMLFTGICILLIGMGLVIYSGSQGPNANFLISGLGVFLICLGVPLITKSIRKKKRS